MVFSLRRILISSITIVPLSLSSVLDRCSCSVSSVKLMYCALSFCASLFARVVFPTAGVPVMRMTRLVIVAYLVVVVVISFVLSDVSLGGH